MRDDAFFGLVCPFLNADPVYTAGVEFGLLWARFRDPDVDEIAEYIRSENEEQIRLACHRLGWEVVDLEPWDDGPLENGWVFVRLVRRVPTEAI